MRYLAAMRALRYINFEAGEADKAGESADLDALRLLKSFTSLADSSQREEILALAERFASSSPHFSDLMQRLRPNH